MRVKLVDPSGDQLLLSDEKEDIDFTNEYCPEDVMAILLTAFKDDGDILKGEEDVGGNGAPIYITPTMARTLITELTAALSRPSRV